MSQKDINRGTSILFADGQERAIRPLTIRYLRPFMKVVSEIDITKTILEDKDIDLMINAAKIVFDSNKINVSEDEVQDILDIVSFNKLFSAAMGADPNE